MKMTSANITKNITSTLCLTFTLFISGCFDAPENKATPVESENITEKTTVVDDYKVEESSTSEIEITENDDTKKSWDDVKEAGKEIWVKSKVAGEDVWILSKETSKKAFEESKETSKKLWEESEESGQELWQDSKKESQALWGKSKEKTAETWEVIEESSEKIWQENSNKMEEMFKKFDTDSSDSAADAFNKHNEAFNSDEI